MKVQIIAASVIGIGLLATACQAEGQAIVAPAPAAQVQPAATAIPSPSEDAGQEHASEAEHESDGQAIFATAGCAVCHGDDAQGTDIAPALAGHSVTQVKRQARAPIGTMPVFPPDKISNEELQELAEFIAGLDGGHAHARAGISGDDLLMHHWMALAAIEAGELLEASHHIGHIVDGAEGQHLRMMEKSRDLLSDGDVHDAAHIIEQMLAGLDEGDSDEATMHMRLAISSLRTDDLPNAIHQVEHFAATTTEDNYEAAQLILASLISGDVHEVDERMAMLVGDDGMVDGHAMAGEDEAGHDDGHDEGEEAHEDHKAAEVEHDEDEAHEDEHDETEANHDDKDAEGLDEHEADEHDETESSHDDEHEPEDAHDDEGEHHEEESDEEHDDDGHEH